MKKGFTLIELLVVVLIIGILSAVALPQYRLAVTKTRSMEILTNLKTIYQAEELYYMENSTYTADMELLGIELDPNTYRLILRRANSYYCQASKPNDKSGLVFQLDSLNGQIFVDCIANTSEFNAKVCQSLGGTYSDSTPAGSKYYRLYNYKK